MAEVRSNQGPIVGEPAPDIPPVLDYTIRAYHAQADFFRSELKEGPNRQPPMPGEQLDIHRRQLADTLSALAARGEADVIYLPGSEPAEAPTA